MKTFFNLIKCIVLPSVIPKLLFSVIIIPFAVLWQVLKHRLVLGVYSFNWIMYVMLRAKYHLFIWYVLLGQ